MTNLLIMIGRMPACDKKMLISTIKIVGRAYYLKKKR